ncbi:hypothetical protein B566_EDAN009655 [Ephemera danica]|nr:hypothetical protein B566_EDAN009655 [Ephemera danica]
MAENKNEDEKFECYICKFERWKLKEEETTCSFFTRTHKFVDESTGNVTSYYACHRDGNYESESTGQRSLKSQGSCKIGGACPAKMKVKVSSESLQIDVDYTSTHFGHAAEPGHERIPKHGRAIIIEKLKNKVPPKAIVDDIRDSTPTTSRLAQTTARDVRNIKLAAGINEEHKLHPDDHTSVHLWINRLKETNQVLYHKAQGETDQQNPNLNVKDFILVFQTPEQSKLFKKFCHVDPNETGSGIVCIDSTHGMGYGFELTTIMSIDELGNGFPVAQMISSSVNTDTLTIFFQCLRNKHGKIQCSVFMSDDFNAFSNAWSNVMEDTSYTKLLCTWHVDRAWQSKLNMKCEDSRQLYRELKTLQMEADSATFEIAMQGLMKKVEETENLQQYKKYIEKYYRSRESWAYCYRANLHMNTNMFLEAFHKKLKHAYFDGKIIKRLDKSLYLLLKLLKDVSIERDIKLMKNTPSYRVRKIEKSHRESFHIPHGDVEVVEPKMWSVKSQSCEAYYIVEQLQEDCTVYNNGPCKIRCSICHVCVHMFKCNCVSALVGPGLCKHMHSVVRKFFMSLKLLDKPELLTQQDINEEYTSGSKVINEQENESNLATLTAQSIVKLCHTKLPYATNPEQVSNVLGELQRIEKNLEAMETSTKDGFKTVKEPAVMTSSNQRNIDPQPRFQSVKRKKKSSKLSLKRPTVSEQYSTIDRLVKLGPAAANYQDGLLHLQILNLQNKSRTQNFNEIYDRNARKKKWIG